MFKRLPIKKQRYPAESKMRARELRILGKTYKEIRDALKIPRSTLCTWLAKEALFPFDRETQLKHLENIRPLAIAAKHKKKETETQEIAVKIREEFSSFPTNDKHISKTILAMLYWAEGAKYEGVSGLRFVNTDPKLMKLYITLLRKCFEIDENRFWVRLHLHYYHPIKSSRRYWADILGISEAQFAPVYIKKRSRHKRFRKNFKGICLLTYNESSIRKDLMALGQILHDKLVSY